MKTLLRIIFASLMLLSKASTASGETLTLAFEELASSEFDTVANGVGKIGASQDPRALAVLTALEDGTLHSDSRNALYIITSGVSQPLDASSGAPSAPLRRIQVNNRVRRALGIAVAAKRLEANEVSTRLAAATEMAKHPSPDLRPALERGTQRERDDKVLEALELALARLNLESDDRGRRLAALKTIAKYADLSFRPDLEALRARGLGKDDELSKALGNAEQAIESRLLFVNAVANTFYGISLGSVLLLAALGLAITFGLMRVINMAHGEMLMLGAYATFCAERLFSTYWPSLTNYYLLAAVPLAFLATAGVGILLEYFVVKRLYGRPLETLLATWGLSLILIQTIRLLFGAQNVTVTNPSWLSGGVELLPNLVLPYNRVAIVGFSAAIVTGIALLLTRTNFGLQIRAVTQNRAMASSMGIPATRVDSLTFGLGSGLAGLGGVALSQIGNVGPELGQTYIVDSFMVVVLGGVGKLLGTVLGAAGLGLLNKYFEPALGAVLGKIVILGLVIVFLQRRPQGLFALKGRSLEVA